MFNFSCSKNFVYDKDASKKVVLEEETTIVFEGGINGTQSEAGALAALVPIAIDLGFKVTNSLLEKNVKKYSSEYISQQSYIGDARKIPNFKLIRYVNDVLALQISFEAKEVKPGYSMVYYVKDIEVHYSKARLKEKEDKLDYTIELKPIFVTDGKKSPQELAPISLSTISVGSKIDFSASNGSENPIKKDYFRYRTDLIMVPKNSVLSEIHLKIIETNPRKVKSEKILETFTNYKDEAKTIINNFVGGSDSKDANTTQSSPGAAGGSAPGSSPEN
jgi:hypothetical protein